MKQIVANALWYTLGRRNMARVGRFISKQARLDIPNDMATNGETLLMRAVMNNVGKEETLTVFDVGANVGNWTRRLLDLANSEGIKIEVHLFEACGETFCTLQEKVRQWPEISSIHLRKSAMSSVEGHATFFSSGKNIGTNSLHGDSVSTFCSKEQVDTETIASYCKQAKVKQIGLLKIDTEGHDYEVIRGASSLLEKELIKVVQFEYNHRWIYSRHYLKDVFELVAAYPYRVGKLTPLGIEYYPHWHYELETFNEGNYVLVNEHSILNMPAVKWWNGSADH